MSFDIDTPMTPYCIMQAVENAKDEDLMLSRIDCHASRVDSIVIAKKDHGLQRVFMTWPGHQLAYNGYLNQYVVGPHTHYNFLLFRVLAGDVYDMRYAEGKGPKMYAYRRKGGLGEAEIIKRDETKLTCYTCFRLDPKKQYAAYCDDIHTMRVKSQLAMWAVQEHKPQCPPTETRVFSSEYETPEPSANFYIEPECADDVRNLVYTWINQYTLSHGIPEAE